MNSKHQKYFVLAGIFLSFSCLSHASSPSAAVGYPSSNNEQIARGGGGRGGEGDRGREGAYDHPANYEHQEANYGGRGPDSRYEQNINQSIRRDAGDQPYRNDYNGNAYGGYYNNGSEFAPTYVAPVVPIPQPVVTPVVNPAYPVVNPSYNVDPYLPQH